MNHNRKRRETERKLREAQERERRRKESASKVGVLVDYSALSPCSSYGPPDFYERGYYLDFPFACAWCGSEEVWTAGQQKWWYEVAKGDLFTGASLCRSCRRQAREEKGKAHPLHDLRRWLRLIRDELEPALLSGGWRLAPEGFDQFPYQLVYARDDVFLRLRWSNDENFRSVLLLERRDARANDYRLIHTSSPVQPYKLSHAELQRRFDEFLEATRSELAV